MDFHRIRLRGHWTCEAIGDTLCQIRRFGTPVRLDPGVQVWLIIESITPKGNVSLNGRALASGVASLALDITARMTVRNELRIQSPGPVHLGEIYLEFRSNEATEGPR